MTFPLLAAVSDGPSIVAMLSGAIATLSATVLVLWRENRKLHRDIVAVYKERDAQHEKDAEMMRVAVGHLEAIHEATVRRGRP